MRINLFHSRAPNSLRVPVTVNITQNDIVNTNNGEVVFLITLDVGILDKNGNRIDTVVLNDVLKENIKKEISHGLALIAEQINWTDLLDDNAPPNIKYIYPVKDQTQVPIYSNVDVKLRDEFPMSGIDPSTIKLFVNDIEVTTDLLLRQSDNEVDIKWIPVRITE